MRNLVKRNLEEIPDFWWLRSNWIPDRTGIVLTGIVDGIDTEGYDTSVTAESTYRNRGYSVCFAI